MCGNCCREWQVRLVKDEVEKLKKCYPAKNFYHEENNNYFLEHKNNRDCVFLDSDKLCSIHKESGYDYKPFPCRCFPFQFFYDGDNVNITCSFACPSIVHNTGNTITKDEIKSFIDEEKETILKLPQKIKFTETILLDFSIYKKFVENLNKIFLLQISLNNKILYGSFLLNDIISGTFKLLDTTEYEKRKLTLKYSVNNKNILLTSLIISNESSLKKYSILRRTFISFKFLLGLGDIYLHSAKNIPLKLRMINSQNVSINNESTVERFFINSIHSRFFLNHETVWNAYVIWAVTYELIRTYANALKESNTEDYISKSLIIVSRYYFHHTQYSQKLFLQKRIKNLFRHYTRNPDFFSFLLKG
ncbi:MAG: YkgJ family cysteine cluster protein [Candidatus Hydrogenedentota bacterium]